MYFQTKNTDWRGSGCRTPSNPGSPIGALILLRVCRKGVLGRFTHVCASFCTCLVWVDKEAALRQYIGVKVIVGDLVQNVALRA